MLSYEISFSQEEPNDAVYIILDASGSMWGQLPDNKTKIEVAEVLQEFVEGDFQGKDLAFRIYGHRRKGDSTDSELLIPFGRPEDVVLGIKES